VAEEFSGIGRDFRKLTCDSRIGGLLPITTILLESHHERQTAAGCIRKTSSAREVAKTWQLRDANVDLAQGEHSPAFTCKDYWSAFSSLTASYLC
jgi:hypothetical protein